MKTLVRGTIGIVVVVALAAGAPGLRQPRAEAATSALFYSQVCQTDGRVQVHFFWTGNDPGALQQWLDLSLFNNGWLTGTFLGAGPLAPATTDLVWSGLIPDAIHYVRVNQLEPGGFWDPSPTFFFQTLACAPSGAPAAPTNLVITGAIPDLHQMVPPGGGELGRITISFQDNSNNEDGFRVFQDCGGTVTALFDLEANMNSYGPLQVCRPGRVGVAAFNAAGVSAILWSP
jgi:hypothetical protein